MLVEDQCRLSGLCRPDPFVQNCLPAGNLPNAGLLLTVFSGAKEPLHSSPCDPFSVTVSGALSSQVAPWFGGITEAHLDAAADYIIRIGHAAFPAEKADLPAFEAEKRSYGNLDERLKLPPSDPAFPWATAHYLKLTLVDGVWYVLGGDMPVVRLYSLSRQQQHQGSIGGLKMRSATQTRDS